MIDFHMNVATKATGMDADTSHAWIRDAIVTSPKRSQAWTRIAIFVLVNIRSRCMNA